MDAPSVRCYVGGVRRIYATACKTTILMAMNLLLLGCANPLFYQPDRKLYQTPARVGLVYGDVRFKSADGTTLAGWFVHATNATPKGTVIHCHGNAQNMTAHFSFVDWLPRQGYNVFTFDYRGYGLSEGEADRAGVFADTLAAIEHVRNRPDVDPRRIVVLGQSLGGANALAALGENTNAAASVRAVASDSSFYSYRAIVRDKIRQVPVLSLLRWPLSWLVASDAHSPGPAIARLPPGLPVLILHGKNDQVVPWQHGQRLYEAAHEPRELFLAEGMNHTEALIRSAGCRAMLVDFFDRAMASP